MPARGCGRRWCRSLPICRSRRCWVRWFSLTCCCWWWDCGSLRRRLLVRGTDDREERSTTGDTGEHRGRLSTTEDSEEHGGDLSARVCCGFGSVALGVARDRIRGFELDSGGVGALFGARGAEE